MKTIRWLALIAVSAALAACGGTGPGASSHAGAQASSAAVRAGGQAAARIVQSCITDAHPEACIEGKVPAPRRAALGKCLTRDLASIPGFSTKDAYSAGAQACVVTALRP